MIQYTLRNVPERVDARLREAAAQYGVSLNTAALDALARALGIEGEPVIHHDLDDPGSRMKRWIARWRRWTGSIRNSGDEPGDRHQPLP